jgi:hypothetical protein
VTACNDRRAAPPNSYDDRVEERRAAFAQLADGEVIAVRTDATELAVGAHALVWSQATSTESTSIVALPLDGGPVYTVLTTRAGISELGVAGDRAVFLFSPLHAGAPGGVAEIALKPHATMQVVDRGSSIAIGGDVVYVATRSGGLYTWPDHKQLATFHGLAWSLVAHDGVVGWVLTPEFARADDRNKPIGTLEALIDGKVVELAHGLAIHDLELVVDARAAYYLQGREIWSVPLAGNEPPAKLVADTGDATGLFVGNGALYWCAHASGPAGPASWNAIMRLALDEPRATPVAFVHDPAMQAIAACSADAIFWSTSSCPPHAGTCIRRMRITSSP